MMKLAVFVLFLGPGMSMARLTGSQPKPQLDSNQTLAANAGLHPQSQERALLVAADNAFLGTCSSDTDCLIAYTCNTNVGRCDRKQAYERYSLCMVDSHCNDGSTKYCNTNVESDISSKGLGLCQRVPNGSMVAFCTESDHCNAPLTCGNQGAYGKTCAKIGATTCGGNYQCASNQCVDGVCTTYDEKCWRRGVLSKSYRSGDCIPSSITYCPTRTHKHTIADNEIITGSCGFWQTVSDAIKNDDDVDYYHDSNWAKGGWDNEKTSVTGTLKNCAYFSEFCFGSEDFGLGCKVDRYIC